MPVNPNIILSGMPQPFDTNALLQQQISGMENINALERQRRADELAMQDRAAAAEKAAQAEAARALAPAVAAAFADPTDAGLDAAFSMVPGEYAEAAEVQLSQLRGIPDVKRRKDVIRAALLQDEYGQALLAQLEPTANMRLQADTAAQRAALDARRLQMEEQQLAAELGRPPKGNYERFETDEGIFILNRDTGEIAPATLAPTEAPISAEVPPQPRVLKPAKKETAEEVKKRLADEKRAKDLAFAVEQVEAAAVPNGLLDKATGSYLGNLVDTAAQTIGYGTEGAIANARMKPIADLVLKMVPRFEGPQAIPDVQSYKEAAGDLANPNLPTSVKKAAAAEIVRLFKKYQDQFEYAPEGAAGAEEAPAAEGPPQITSDEEYDALPSGAEFLDPDGVLRRKP